LKLSKLKGLASEFWQTKRTKHDIWHSLYWQFTWRQEHAHITSPISKLKNVDSNRLNRTFGPTTYLFFLTSKNQLYYHRQRNCCSTSCAKTITERSKSYQDYIIVSWCPYIKAGSTINYEYHNSKIFPFGFLCTPLLVKLVLAVSFLMYNIYDVILTTWLQFHCI